MSTTLLLFFLFSFFLSIIFVSSYAELLTNSFKTATKKFDEAALQGEAAMDTMKMITVKLNSTATELANVIKNSIPDAVDSRRKIFYYSRNFFLKPSYYIFNYVRTS